MTEKALEATEGESIYDLEFIGGTSEWDDMFKQAKDKINKKGATEGHLVSSTNDSTNEGGVVMVLSWKHIMQTNIQELARPAGCCGSGEQCTIF